MITVVGSYGAGISASVPRVPEAGETISGSTVSIGHGGKSSNQAVAIARQEGEVRLLTALGEDSFAQSARALWDCEGVAHHDVITKPGSTMTGIIMVEPSGENRIFIAPGVLDQITPADIEASAEAFQSADIVVVGLEIPAEAAEAAIRTAKSCGAVVVLNPAPAAALSHEVLAMVDYLVPNQTENAFYDAHGYQPPRSQTVILTKGSEGAEVREAHGSTRIAPLVPDAVVDTTGAGDTFVGTFAAALDAGEDVQSAARRAVVASSLSVRTAEVIPSIPHRAAVDSALAHYMTGDQ